MHLISLADRMFIIKQRHKGISYLRIAKELNRKNRLAKISAQKVKTIFSRFENTGTVLYNNEMKNLMNRNSKKSKIDVRSMKFIETRTYPSAKSLTKQVK